MQHEKKRRGLIEETRQYWPEMGLHERFEQVVALILSLAIGVVVAAALWEVLLRIGLLLLSGSLDPQDHKVFQAVFGMIMTLLIAMEFQYSIIRFYKRRDNIIQVKTVILIAILALARKFIVIDTSSADAGKLAALAAIVLALGLVYWLMNISDTRDLHAEAPQEKQPPGNNGVRLD